MDRKPLLPEFTGSVFEGYAVGFLTNHFWRVSYTFGDFEDALSEACVCYYDCRRLYGARVNSQKHFMALYKRMMWSYFTDWAYYDTKQRNILVNYKEKAQVVNSEGPMMAALNQASKELKQILQIIFNGPAEVVTILKQDAKIGADEVFSHAAQLCNIPSDHTLELKNELYMLLS